MILTSLSTTPSDIEERVGWSVQPEGLCRGDRCVPAPDELRWDTVAARLQMALEHDPEAGVWALGPESGGRALTSATMPELELPDIDGNPFRLSALHGRKVLLVAWASW